jgi:hypothetical protein
VRIARHISVALAITLSAAGFTLPAAAANITATYNFNGLGNNASSSAVQSYMSGVLQSLGYGPNLVTVTGGIAQQGASSYAGEGYVVGPKISGTVDPLTLANTNNSATPNTTTSYWDSNPPTLSNSNTDGFIQNCTSVDPALSSNGATGCGSSSSNIFINFKGLQIASVSFNLEIFPNGSCPSESNCGGAGNPDLPNLELWTGDNGTGTDLATYYGVVPGTDGTYADSPNDPNGETAPQLLGVSGLITIGANLDVTSLDFMDWPDTIGIDNLVVTFKTPEPGSMAIFGFGLLALIGFAGCQRFRLAHSSSPETPSQADA